MNQTKLINELEALGIYVQSLRVTQNYSHNVSLDIQGLYKPKEDNKMTKLTSQADAVQAVRASGLFIGSVDASGNFSMASNPTIQLNGTEARAEAKRLAKVNTGKLFFIGQLRGAELVPVAPTLSI